jgi:hypothetical protein
MKRFLLAAAILGFSNSAIAESQSEAIARTIAKRKAFKATQRQGAQRTRSEVNSYIKQIQDFEIAKGLAYGCPICGKQHHPQNSKSKNH